MQSHPRASLDNENREGSDEYAPSAFNYGRGIRADTPPFICAILPSNCLHDEPMLLQDATRLEGATFGDLRAFEDEEIRSREAGY